MVEKHIEIIAHRGASYEAPENTLAAVNLAWQQDADAVEIDIHMTKDLQIVVIHDDDTKRTGSKRGKIKNQSLDELKELDFGKFKGEEWIDERIPTLSEVLQTVPEGRTVFIEIKCGPRIIPELKTVLKSSAVRPNQVAFIDFDLNSIMMVKQSLPQCKALWNRHFLELWGKTIWKTSAERLISKARWAGIDGMSFFACNAVDAAFVSKIKASGMDVIVWTVNDPSAAERFVASGVDGIMTDLPLWLRQQLFMRKSHDV